MNQYVEPEQIWDDSDSEEEKWTPPPEIPIDEIRMPMGQYWCLICGRYFRYYKWLLAHHETHTKKGHLCTACCKIFRRRRDILVHNCNQFKVIFHRCKMCRKLFPTYGERLDHDCMHFKNGLMDKKAVDAQKKSVNNFVMDVFNNCVKPEINYVESTIDRLPPISQFTVPILKRFVDQYEAHTYKILTGRKNEVLCRTFNTLQNLSLTEHLEKTPEFYDEEDSTSLAEYDEMNSEKLCIFDKLEYDPVTLPSLKSTQKDVSHDADISNNVYSDEALVPGIKSRTGALIEIIEFGNKLEITARSKQDLPDILKPRVAIYKQDLRIMRRKRKYLVGMVDIIITQFYL